MNFSVVQSALCMQCNSPQELICYGAMSGTPTAAKASSNCDMLLCDSGEKETSERKQGCC